MLENNILYNVLISFILYVPLKVNKSVLGGINPHIGKKDVWMSAITSSSTINFRIITLSLSSFLILKTFMSFAILRHIATPAAAFDSEFMNIS